MEYLRVAKAQGISFRRYLQVIGFTDPATSTVGMDDGALFRVRPEGPELIDIPSQPITGDLQVKVLLVDFDDKEGDTPIQHYQDLLFSDGVYPTGSMRDYYREVSLNQVDLTGTVHGWLRMPETYAFYTNRESGTKSSSYPRNAQRMAEDAVRVALDHGITFDRGLDKLGEGSITALFIVHAGRGAETIRQRFLQNAEIWSHKWSLRRPVEVATNLWASVYLTVPEGCKVGVCAHELGHLAFQWQDFYDPNYDKDDKEWDGCGRWDLMAGGSYNGGGARPAHPVGLHKSQHGWVDVQNVTETIRGITIPPFTNRGKVVRVTSPEYTSTQYLLLENRQRVGFDFDLPGEGLLVWRVDESRKMVEPEYPGLQLVQADGRHDLERPNDWNKGDAGDPFPGESSRTSLSDQGTISTSFKGQEPSGIRLENISVDAGTRIASLDIIFR